MHNRQKGITGLETAIILIAFVVVAAVFAYTVLSAGLFSSQKSSEAVYSGLEEAQSTMNITGGVIGFDTSADQDLDYIKVTVSNTLNGEPINFTVPTDAGTDGKADSGSSNVVTISYVDALERVDDLSWSITKIGDCDADSLLETGERFEITIPAATVEDSDDFTGVLTTDIGVSTQFKVEVKPPTGAVLEIERTTPAYLDPVMNLN
jgi:flagellin FlaB